MDVAQGPARGDLLDLGVVNAVAVLVADHGLDATTVDQLLHGLARGGGVRHGLLERDQLRAAIDTDLDELLAHMRHRAKAENVRLQRFRESRGIFGCLDVPADLGLGRGHPSLVDVADPRDLETVAVLEGRGVVHPTLAHAYDDD